MGLLHPGSLQAMTTSFGRGTLGLAAQLRLGISLLLLSSCLQLSWLR